MKVYKQRIMLNYQNIPGSHNDTKCIAKYPYSPLYAKRFVNEFKAIDVINYTDKIKHSELLIYDEFQFVDLPYFHKQFIWSFNHISQSFKVTHLCYVQNQPKRNNDSGLTKNAVKKKSKWNQEEKYFSYFSSDILITNVKKKNLSFEKKTPFMVLCKVIHI